MLGEKNKQMIEGRTEEKCYGKNYKEQEKDTATGMNVVNNP